ncbi:MAG: hypothetical protein KTR14_07650 [Vampirovibrio sp.]|nr:hypothetical protein [Vampirovibrio sp.]
MIIRFLALILLMLAVHVFFGLMILGHVESVFHRDAAWHSRALADTLTTTINAHIKRRDYKDDEIYDYLQNIVNDNRNSPYGTVSIHEFDGSYLFVPTPDPKGENTLNKHLAEFFTPYNLYFLTQGGDHQRRKTGYQLINLNQMPTDSSGGVVRNASNTETLGYVGISRLDQYGWMLIVSHPKQFMEKDYIQLVGITVSGIAGVYLVSIFLSLLLLRPVWRSEALTGAGGSGSNAEEYKTFQEAAEPGLNDMPSQQFPWFLYLGASLLGVVLAGTILLKSRYVDFYAISKYFDLSDVISLTVISALAIALLVVTVKKKPWTKLDSMK